MQSVRSECVSAEQVAEILMSAKETASQAISGVTARWFQMPTGDTIILVEGMMGEALKFFH